MELKVLGYWCYVCKMLYEEKDHDFEQNEFNDKLCPYCDNILEECDGTT